VPTINWSNALKNEQPEIAAINEQLRENERRLRKQNEVLAKLGIRFRRRSR
jgi:hypothetical protein